MLPPEKTFIIDGREGGREGERTSFFFLAGKPRREIHFGGKNAAMTSAVTLLSRLDPVNISRGGDLVQLHDKTHNDGG